MPPNQPLRDPKAAARDDTVTAVLGPTNTGKTHYAVERMLGRASGVFGFPLRLLAREIYDRVVALRGPRAAALITGEEKIAPPEAKYVLCTVEAMPLDWGAAFVAVDEIQLCADPDRGHVFTDRLLRARGTEETLFLGSDTMRGRIAALIPKARFVSRPRFSTLSYAGSKKVSRLPPRSAVVAFSVDSVYAMAELLRRQKGGAAVVTGALSPRTRNAQVALYQNGDVEHLVATDAIGMGLNLDLRHVAFGGVKKFDGRRYRWLEPQELGQIAGRAGRHVTDGTFGVTGEASPLDPDVIERIESHAFDPAPKLQWRNARLEFGSVDALLRSLETAPPHRDLIRARDADDAIALRHMWADPEIHAIARGGPSVRLLWDVCQTPDFRKTAPAEHAALLSRIYRFLHGDAGVIPADWIAAQVARLDRTTGDLDTLSKRLAHVRTWTYVANRSRWLRDPEDWRAQTRALEDRLSDALHDRLTQRFVDRRTSVLMRRLKQKEKLVADVSDTGDVTVEGHHVGRLEGFRFRPDEDASAEELKTLKSASLQALQAHFSHRVDKFYNAPDTEIDVTDQGGLMWGEHAVGRLEPGPDALNPETRAFVDDSCEPAVAEKVARRLGHWIDRRIKTLFEPLLAMRDDPALTGLPRGVAFQMVEALGVTPRKAVAEDIKALDQEGRALLRKHGVRFGQHHVFMPALLKPAPTRFRLLLWALHQKLDDFPAAPPPGLVTIPTVAGLPEGYYVRAGYRRAGARALRIDMLERLADMIRQRDARAGFEAAPEMLSITGCTLEQFADLMKGLGYAAERGERPKPARTPAEAPAAATETETETETETTVAEDGAGTDAMAETAAAPPAETPTDGADVPPQAPDAAAAADPAPSPDPSPPDPSPTPDDSAPTSDSAAEAVAEPTHAPQPAPDAAAQAEAAAPPDGPAGEMEIFFVFRQEARRRPGGADRSGGPRRRRDADTARQSDAAPARGGGKADGGAAPDPKKGDNPRRGGGRGPQQGAPKGGGDKRQGGPRGDGPRGDGKGFDGKRGGGPKPRREDTRPRVYDAAPARDAGKSDADNPFAVLKQLRDKL